MWSMRAGLLLAIHWLAGCGGRSELLDAPDSTKYFAFVADSRELEHFELHVVDAFDPAQRIRRVSNTENSVGSYEPTWSPDGRWLSFHAHELFVADSLDDFSVRQLASEPAECHWSSTSRWLACFVDDAAPALVVKDILGLEPDIVEPVVPPSYDGIAHWSPTQDRIVFSRGQSASVAQEWFIAEPGQPTRALGVANTGWGAWKLRWSPDGAHIALLLVESTKRELLYVVDVDENPMAPRLLLDPGVDDSVFDYAWSGDSTLLVARSKLGLWSVSTVGEPNAKVFAAQTYDWTVGDRGRTLAYVADEPGIPPRALYVRDLAGGQVGNARSSGASDIQYLAASATSDALFIQMWDEPDRLYYARSTGGPATALHEAATPSVGQVTPPIAPGGERILLALGHDELELRVVELSQNPTTRLTLASGWFSDAQWGTSSFFSFVHGDGYDSWESLYIGSAHADGLQRVYTPHSNLRRVQWTGWQP
jgi:Tol biopolymer transport system component